MIGHRPRLAPSRATPALMVRVVRVVRMLRVIVLGALSGALVACGGAAPRETTVPPSPTREGEPMTIAEAQEQIARARDELAAGGMASSPTSQADRPAGGGTPDEAPSAPPAPGAQSGPSEPRAPSPPRATTSTGTRPGQAHRPATDASRCTSPCRALASMRRAVLSLCRMTGETDRRCIDAKHTLADSEHRVAGCSC